MSRTSVLSMRSRSSSPGSSSTSVLPHRVVAVQRRLLGKLRGWLAEGREDVLWVLPRGTACVLQCVRTWAIERALIIAISSVR